MYLAQEIARLIESDPVAACQVKEHIKPARLCELLDVVPEPDPEQERPYSDLDSVSDDRLLDYVANRFTRTEILRAIK